jgi:predicted metalloprotease
MSFNDNVQIDSGRVEDRRGGGGRGGMVAGGGISILGLILALIFGPGILDQGGDTSQQASTGQTQSTANSSCTTGAAANKDDVCRLTATTQSLDNFWSQELPAHNVQFRKPKMVTFTGATSSGCGRATAQTGPFYCPTDETAYVDTAFYKQFTSQFGGSSGPLAQIYIVSHEYGHHIQNILGDLDKSQNDPQGATSGGVRTELQADCYAGLYIGHAATTKDPKTGQTYMKPITETQVRDALAAAASVGDDHIQQTAQGQVNQDSWTHGSSAQRQAWFIQGYKSQDMTQCNTFTAQDLNNPGT